MILNELKLAGQVIRRAYQRVLPEDPTKDYYYIIRDTANIQSLLVEYGFLDNVQDANRLRYNWQRYAEATVKAICDYIGYPYRPPYSGETIYTVRAGDTLFSIAQRFQTTVEAIKSLNNLTSTILTIGQRLKIPFFTTEPPIPPEETFIYTVVAGDSLWSIAQRFNTTVEEIKSLNNLTSNLLSIGQQLRIPGNNDTVPSIPGEMITYTVVRGDSLWSIAQRFNTTVEEIKSLNNLTSNLLSIGQELKIPGGSPNYITYTVVRGDSLWSIAQRFNVTVEEIKIFNNLTSNLLSIGQNLRIPL